MIKQGSQGRLANDEDKMGEEKKKKRAEKNLIRTSFLRPPEKASEGAGIK